MPDAKPPHLVILVANFPGPDPEGIRLTENILRVLRDETAAFPEVIVKALDQTITAQQGSEAALRKAEDNQAYLVLWGFYGLHGNDLQLEWHCDIPQSRPIPGLPLAAHQYQSMGADELKGCLFQERTSRQVTRMALFVVGMILYARREYGPAAERFSHALAQADASDKYFNFGDLYFYRGNCYLQVGELDNAVSDYQQAIQHNPKDASSFGNLGFVYSLKSRRRDALEMLNKAISLKPCYSLALNNRGVVQEALARKPQAWDDYNRAIECDSENYLAYNNRALLFKAKGDLDHALEDYNKAIKSNPYNFKAFGNRAAIYLNMGKYKQAIDDSTRAIDLNPNYFFAYINRAGAYANTGRPSKAIDDCNRAIQIDGQDVRAYMNRALAYALSGQFPLAFNDCDTVMKLRSLDAVAVRGDRVKKISVQGDFDAFFLRGQVRELAGKKEQAINDFKEALRLAQTNDQQKLAKQRITKLGGR